VALNGDLRELEGAASAAGTIGGRDGPRGGPGGELIVLMYTATKKGESKARTECTYPITARPASRKVVTNLALVEVVRGNGLPCFARSAGSHGRRGAASDRRGAYRGADVREMDFSA